MLIHAAGAGVCGGNHPQHCWSHSPAGCLAGELCWDHAHSITSPTPHQAKNAPHGTVSTAWLRLAPQGGHLGNAQIRAKNFFVLPMREISSPSKETVKIVPQETKRLSPLSHSVKQRHHLAQISKHQKTPTIKSSWVTKSLYLKIL